LVIETGVYSGPTRESGPYAEHEELWSLDSEGVLHITVTDRGSGTEPKTTNLTYRRPSLPRHVSLRNRYFDE
jgi:hypothetical protein